MDIGTTNLGAKLEINGNLLFTGTSTVSHAAGLFNLTVRDRWTFKRRDNDYSWMPGRNSCRWLRWKS
ncbi:MAG: hypothetical protein A2X08_13180 [Bacteroidetes bacterium GWA2_32_17]|nr:MAG: hypothetical protein A2X08_13180 [Bacteroidetes bacterium GWA2_32_17]